MLLLTVVILTSSDCNNSEPLIEEIPEPIEISISSREYYFKANTCSYENSIDSIMIENIDSLENLTVTIDFGTSQYVWLESEEIDTTNGKIDLETIVKDLPIGKYVAKITLNADNAIAEKIIEVELEITDKVREDIVGKVIVTLNFQGTPPDNFKVPYFYERFFPGNLTTKISGLGYNCTRSEVVKEFCYPVGIYRLTFSQFDNCSLLGQSQFAFEVKENEVEIISLTYRCP